MRNTANHDADMPADPRLDVALRRMLLIGAALVVALPAARGSNAWLGALPLWLLAMPAASWWALHRFRLPRVVGARTQRRRRTGQARRRRDKRLLPSLRRAA